MLVTWSPHHEAVNVSRWNIINSLFGDWFCGRGSPMLFENQASLNIIPDVARAGI